MTHLYDIPELSKDFVKKMCPAKVMCDPAIMGLLAMQHYKKTGDINSLLYCYGRDLEQWLWRKYGPKYHNAMSA